MNRYMDVLQVDGVLYDLDRPLEQDCTLEILKFDDDEGRKIDCARGRRKTKTIFLNAYLLLLLLLIIIFLLLPLFLLLLLLLLLLLSGKQVFWHSSAHILGESMEKHYGGCLCYGPPIENGFYYDMFLEGRYLISFSNPHFHTGLFTVDK